MSETPGQQRVIDIYARVSRKGDKEQRSVTSQAQVCRAVLAERDLPAGETFTDDGRSAWNPRVKRKEWALLMQRLEQGISGGCIVYDLSRFSRQVLEGERLIAAADRGLLILDSESEYDLTKPNGKANFREAVVRSAYYSDDLQRKVKRGKLAKAMGGQVDQRRSFGFEPDGVTIRESEAVWVRWAAEHILHGDPQDKVVDHLNSRGVRTAPTPGHPEPGPWTQRGLRDMLTRPRNAGHLAHNGVAVARLPEPHILDQATLDRLTAKYAARRRGRPPSPKYLCSGLVYCECGKPLAGRPRAGVRPYPDGEVRREYWCSPSAYKGCARVFIDQRGLDAFAADLALTILSDPANAGQIEAAAAAADEAAAALDSLIAEAEETALQVGDRLGRGEISLARHDAITGPLDRRLAELREARAALAVPAPVPARLSRQAWERRWEDALPEERRELLRLALGKRTLVIARAAPAMRADVEARISYGAPASM